MAAGSTTSKLSGREGGPEQEQGAGAGQEGIIWQLSFDSYQVASHVTLSFDSYQLPFALVPWRG